MARYQFKIDWTVLSPERFEEFCSDLLRVLGFINVRWHGRGGGDRGRDIVAEKVEEFFTGQKRTLKVIAQCKHYSKQVRPSDLQGTIAWADVHRPDLLLVLTSGTYSSATLDWMSQLERTKPYRVYALGRGDLEIQLLRHPEALSGYFSLGNGLSSDALPDSTVRCAYCNALTEGQGVYFVLVTCDGCEEIAAVCSNCIANSKHVGQTISCIGCGDKLHLGSGELRFFGQIPE